MGLISVALLSKCHIMNSSLRLWWCSLPIPQGKLFYRSKGPLEGRRSAFASSHYCSPVLSTLAVRRYRAIYKAWGSFQSCLLERHEQALNNINKYIYVCVTGQRLVSHLDILSRKLSVSLCLQVTLVQRDCV